MRARPHRKPETPGRRRLDPRLWLRLLLALVFSPFLLAFGRPDSAGTYVSATGGGGRTSFTTSSCGYTQHIRSSMYHGGVAVDQRIRTRKTESPRSHSIAPRLVSLGVSANAGSGNSYSFDTRDSAYTGERLNEERWRWQLQGVGARVSLDWRYVGLTMGAIAGNPEYGAEILPSFGLRLGDKLYYSLSMFEQPLSPLALGETGFGFKARDIGIWYGLRLPHEGNPTPTLKMYRLFRTGEIGVTLMATPFGDDRLDYGAAVTAGFRLPTINPR